MKIFWCFLVFSLTFSTFAGNSKVFIVVNKENKTETISKGELQNYFLKNERSWKDGTPVKFFDRKELEVRSCFLKHYIGKNSEELSSFWMQKKNKGDFSHTQVEGDEMTVMMVAYFPGGIGYVSEKFMGDVRVKILRIGE